MKITHFVTVSTLLALGLTACTREAAEVNPTPHDMKEGPGLLSGESGNLLNVFSGGNSLAGTSAGAAIGVDPYLWRASLEAVSFMPITQADSSGGTILTDWYVNPNQTNERVKVNVYILGRTLSANALKVAVFKQKSQGDSWVDVTDTQTTATQLEETILTNARAIRVKSMASR